MELIYGMWGHSNMMPMRMQQRWWRGRRYGEQSAATFFAVYCTSWAVEMRLRVLVSMRSWTEVMDISATIGSVVAFQELKNTIILG
jgi:hypothetical protein